MRVFVLCIFVIAIPLASSVGLHEDFTWTRISYVWPNNGEKRTNRQTQSDSRYARKNTSPDAIIFKDEENGSKEDKYSTENGGNLGSIDYQYENNIPMGANVWKNKLFISVPRRRLGVPSTLNYIPLDNPQKHNVPLIPYPNWDINLYPDTGGRRENFVSVYRVGVDPCDRLWFVDTGTIELPGNKTQVIPTTLIIMDLNTDKVMRRYAFPQDQLRPTTTLASITIDVTRDACGDAFAYLPDLGGYGLMVYSLKENKSWRVSHNYFFLEKLAGEFNIAGHNFQWNDGVFSVELTDINSDGFRDMYFHSMAGTNMHKVSTRILRNETLATRSYHGDDFQNIGDRGPQSQTSAADLHKPTGTLFLGLVNQNALGCWNIKRPLDRTSIIQKDDNKMIYPCDVKIYKDKVYLLTNTMPEFLYGKLNYDQVNFRIWSNDVQDAIKGTNC